MKNGASVTLVSSKARIYLERLAIKYGLSEEYKPVKCKSDVTAKKGAKQGVVKQQEVAGDPPCSQQLTSD